MRKVTPQAVEGLSILFCLIQGSENCCPAVVGILNGTGDLPHLIILRINPIKKMPELYKETQQQTNCPVPEQSVPI